MQETHKAVMERKEKLIPTARDWEGFKEETIIERELGGWQGCQETDVRPFYKNQTSSLHAAFIRGTNSVPF